MNICLQHHNVTILRLINLVVDKLSYFVEGLQGLGHWVSLRWLKRARGQCYLLCTISRDKVGIWAALGAPILQHSYKRIIIVIVSGREIHVIAYWDPTVVGLGLGR